MAQHDTAGCDPQVIPYADITDRWVVTCPCGHSTEWATEAEAHADRAQHARGGAR